MEDPCKECWPRVDPYDCWGCKDKEEYNAYLESLKTHPIDTKNTEEE